MIQDTKKVRTSLHPRGFITNIVPCCCGFLFIRDGECAIQCIRFLKPAIPIKLCTLSQDNRHFLLLLHGWRNSCCPTYVILGKKLFQSLLKSNAIVLTVLLWTSILTYFYRNLTVRLQLQSNVCLMRLMECSLKENLSMVNINYPCTCILYLIIQYALSIVREF